MVMRTPTLLTFCHVYYTTADEFAYTACKRHLNCDHSYASVYSEDFKTTRLCIICFVAHTANPSLSLVVPFMYLKAANMSYLSNVCSI